MPHMDFIPMMGPRHTKGKEEIKVETRKPGMLQVKLITAPIKAISAEDSRGLERSTS